MIDIDPLKYVRRRGEIYNMFFNKSFKGHTTDLIEFNGMDISTGEVCEYIVDLYNKNGFRHLGYRGENKDGMIRFIIYSYGEPSSKLKYYFKDRCPAMVEEYIINNIRPRSIALDLGFKTVNYNGDIEIVQPMKGYC